jgi:serine/threonine kinase 3
MNHVAKEDPEEIFEMLEKLGEGSFGIVCKCRHKKDNKIYAVKVIEMEGEDDSAIRREIDILKVCDSDLIVRYGGCYKKANTLLIAMEYCDGGSVQDIIRLRKKQLTEDQIAAICAQIVNALVYLHSNHIMHRDIKCGNVLLTQRGDAKLADFGVSAQLNSTFQKKNTVIGSPYWMAPEIIAKASDGYDTRADIWSLGITAIEMADSEPPRYDVHFARVIFIIPHKPPPTFKNPKEWSAEFVDFTTRCLQKDPKDRPTARELLEHPFIARGSRNKQLIAALVEEALPLIEQHRRERQQRGAQESSTDTFEESNTVVRGVATIEIRGAQGGTSGTFVETEGGSPSAISGLNVDNLKLQ